MNRYWQEVVGGLWAAGAAGAAPAAGLREGVLAAAGATASPGKMCLAGPAAVLLVGRAVLPPAAQPRAGITGYHPLAQPGLLQRKQ